MIYSIRKEKGKENPKNQKGTKMKNNEKSNRGGIGFCGLLAIAFIVLKLCNVITWPWIWVLAPLWIGFVLSILFILLAYWWAGR